MAAEFSLLACVWVVAFLTLGVRGDVWRGNGEPLPHLLGWPGGGTGG